ncbi:hypothetical protein J6590_015064 [Homalodisca vitripennis]|nr:hypothetical protein J6590_015064 [Homalodisca vitripennis]
MPQGESAKCLAGMPGRVGRDVNLETRRSSRRRLRVTIPHHTSLETVEMYTYCVRKYV